MANRQGTDKANSSLHLPPWELCVAEAALGKATSPRVCGARDVNITYSIQHMTNQFKGPAFRKPTPWVNTYCQ